MNSKLQWTVIRPGSLTDGQITGNLKYGTDDMKLKRISGISRANVASFIIKQLTDTNFHQKAVWLCE